jgi:hypothetical protein
MVRILANLQIGASAILCVNTAMAGPPMVTDDSGTASPGVFEMILYTAHEERDSGESTVGPALDLAYGVIADPSIFTLPLVGSIAHDRWAFTGNVGYSISSREFDAISLSGSVGYEITPEFRVLAELWGVDFVNDGDSEAFVNWRTGIQ